MVLLEYLRKAAKSETSVYTTFLQQYSKNDKSLHLFHEGKDDPSFYGNFIENKLKKNRKVYYYQAKNKSSVYHYYSKVNWSSYSRKRIIFCVDKDFSDILKIAFPIDTNIFVTEYYSIENYLVNKNIFSRSLRELIGLENDKKNSFLSKGFKIGLKSFYEASLFLSAYILYHRKLNTPLNLQSIVFGDVFEMDDNFLVKRKKNILKALDGKTGVNTTFNYSDIKDVVIELSKINNPKRYTRGKYELMYLVNCINTSPKILNDQRVKGEKKYKCCVSLSHTNGVQILAPRLKEPKDLNLFLSKNLK
ncbi:MAG: DUF4435 domain-containing protein [Cyclobacteriaceae bacterium]